MTEINSKIESASDSSIGTAFSGDAMGDGILATLPQSNKTSVYVEPCREDFFYEKFSQCYPMFKNPRGHCLIVNIYQINGMPPRRWSDRDTDALTQLFQQLLFKVTVYTDSTHDLGCQNFKQILQDFSRLEEHDEAQCAVICLMSHGEEGFLTTKEGDKVLLDEIFNMFNNANCPKLAGKPKLFFIQSCRDDPITGPAEDIGIRLIQSTNDLTTSAKKTNCEDSETDGMHQTISSSFSDNNTLNNYHQSQAYKQGIEEVENNEINESVDTELDEGSNVLYHMPTFCDMLIGFPTQRGFIAYRKPEIGSWYMNAIVQVFSRHAHDTDLCAMLNMVNSMISGEVTNTGKKQMSEYTSKLTKPYFFFFPGLADTQETTNTIKRKFECHDELSLKKNCLLVNNKNNNNAILLEQADSNWIKQVSFKDVIIEFLCERASAHWKHVAREVNLGESRIAELDRLVNNRDKLKVVLSVWLDQLNIEDQENEIDNFYSKNIEKILTACQLNRIKDEFLQKFSPSKLVTS